MIAKSIDAVVAAYPWPPVDAEQDFRLLLGMLAPDPKITDPRHVAYILATVRHETAFTFRPIEEYGKGAGMAYDRAYSTPYGPVVYYGRGYVQLTWKENYETMGRLLSLDLVNRPYLALDPLVAYPILTMGMMQGIFTGMSLPDYVNEEQCDYVNARKVVNGLDQAEKIAEWAKLFEGSLN